MKQKTIKTTKATILVVEMPEGAKNIRIETNQLIIPYPKMIHYEIPATKEGYGLENTEGFDLPQGNWQLLGRLPDITEEQADLLVEKAKDFVTGEIHYLDYNDDTNLVRKAKQSLHSLLQANDIWFENPQRDPGLMPSAELDLYRQAQSKVWDKKRCYLFLKID